MIMHFNWLKPTIGDNIVDTSSLWTPFSSRHDTFLPHPPTPHPQPPDNVVYCLYRHVAAILQHWKGGRGFLQETCTRPEIIPDPKWSPTSNDPQNRPKHDPKWSPTPNDPQMFWHSTRNDPRRIVGVELENISIPGISVLIPFFG